MINQLEQATDFFIKENNYYCYLKVKHQQNTTETMVKNNIDKYITKDTIKDDYYSQYVDKLYNVSYLNLYEKDDSQLKLKQYYEDLRRQIEDNQHIRNKINEEDQL